MSKIPRREEQRLLAYAAAAGAALTAAGTADATIVYSGPLNRTVTHATSPYTLAGNVLSFSIFAMLNNNIGGTGNAQPADFSVSFRTTTKSLGETKLGYPYAQKLPFASPIKGSTGKWNKSFYSAVNLFSSSGAGQFGSGYLGFRFDNSGVKYGWVQIADVTIDGTDHVLNSFKVVDWAYEDSGAGILAGAGGGGGPSGGGGGGGSDGGSVGAPEPGTVLMGLSALAIGAGYRMRQWRRKRG